MLQELQKTHKQFRNLEWLVLGLIREEEVVVADKQKCRPTQNQRHPCQVISALNDHNSLKKGLYRPFPMTGFCRCGGV
jgi:hypothetical protein